MKRESNGKTPPPDFLTEGDGTGRTPRQVQIDLLNDLSRKWDDKRVHVISGPCGIGKSWVARAIQRKLGGHIVVPQNVLIDQYRETYPDVNFVKGAAWYQCRHAPKNVLITCEERKAQGKKYCSDCIYQAHKRRSQSEPTFFNPMSLYITKRTMTGYMRPQKVMIVDEAHSLLSLMTSVLTKTFRRSTYQYTMEDVKTEISFAEFLGKSLPKLEALLLQKRKAREGAEVKKVYKELSQCKLVYTLLRDSPEDFFLHYEPGVRDGRGKLDDTLTVVPVNVPKSFILDLLGGGNTKLILMSGTMFPTDIAELTGTENYEYYDVPSPIPARQRPLFIDSLPEANIDTPIEDYVRMIRKDLLQYPNMNTIIHCSYSLQERLFPILSSRYSKVYANTKLNKMQVLDEFKRKGGIFLASGCSEGIDLPGDTCRLNIILKMEFPSLGDVRVEKRMAKADGQSWYRQQALKSTIQRYGRTTRSVTDWSITKIHDPNLLPVIVQEQRVGTIIPAYFLEALKIAV